jgi:XTP/dITP diphosphohydrolase
MNILIATKNPGKINEIKKIFYFKSHQLYSLDDFDFFQDFEFNESAETLHGNAEIKVRQCLDLLKKFNSYHEIDFIASEDSGLFVDALNGKPGVYSARYAGTHASDVDNINRLLMEMKTITKRKACFRAVVCVMNKEQKADFFEGELCGTIALEKRGNKGFGYDPVFIPTGYRSTLAELGDDIKNLISHRRKAWEKFFKQL